MRNVPPKVTCGLLILSMLYGCAISSEKKDPTVASEVDGPSDCMKITAEDVDTKYGETVTVGTVLGGVGGAILGTLLAVATQDPSAIVTGAIAGAAFGTAGGAFSGVETAESLQAYAVQEAQLDCQIKAVREDNERLTMLTDAVQRRVQDSQRQLDDLEKRYVAGRVSKNTALRELDEIDRSTNQLARSVDTMKKRRDEYINARNETQKAANNNLNTTELDNQISSYTEKIKASENELKQLIENRRIAQLG
jgi:hypothetical protein